MLQTKNCIYMLTSKITGKKYIGKTERTLKRRLRAHDRDKYKKSNVFHCYLQKYGIESLEISILYVSPHQEKLTDDERRELLDKEREYIAQYKTQNRDFGYNMLAGGEGGAGDEAVRAKISASSLARWQDLEMRNKMISAMRKNYLENGSPLKGRSKYKSEDERRFAKLNSYKEKRRQKGLVYNKFTDAEIEPVINMLKSGMRPRHILARGISKELLNKAQRDLKK